MSLNWKMPDSFNKKLIWRTLKGEPLNLDDKEQEVNVQPELECLIFATMGIQHNLQGEMTDEVLIEISRRIDLLKGIGAMPSYYVSNDEPKQFKKIYPCVESVIRYWGLHTNVSHLTATKWNKYLIRVSQADKYSFKYEKEEALKAIQEYPELTEGDRILQQWKAEAKAELTTPPPTL